jgi:hypothetical protein
VVTGRRLDAVVSCESCHVSQTCSTAGDAIVVTLVAMDDLQLDMLMVPDDAVVGQ